MLDRFRNWIKALTAPAPLQNCCGPHADGLIPADAPHQEPISPLAVPAGEGVVERGYP